ncbi:MAG: M20 metallopeptidase family protein [Bacteroidota bacterium]
MNINERIRSLAEKYFEETRAIRRHIHQNPELSFQEYKTSEFIQKKLAAHKILYKTGYVKTGVLGIIKGRNPEKRVIALRADMDALPVQEKNDLVFSSVNKNVMHACGHDVHTSSLLGTGLILKDLRDEFEGTVLLVFQPGEEKLPGGARLMMEEGVFEEYKPEIVIGQHVMPDLPAGTVGFRPGMYMASTDEIYLTVKGRGGHAAMPHQLTDSVLMTSHIIVAMQQLVSRNANASIPTVLSFGKIIADGATNVIPSEVHVEGTFRTMNETWRAEAHGRIKTIASSIAASMGGSCEVEIRHGYPFLVNNEEITHKAISLAKDFLGETSVVDLDLRMTAEDFAYFSQAFPATFYRLGVMQPGTKNPSPLHSPTFMVDENALKTGIGTMARLALGYL